MADDGTKTTAFDALLFDVTFAIAKSIHTPRKFLMGNAEPLAKDVIAHLHRCGWMLDRAPPISGHGNGKGAGGTP